MAGISRYLSVKGKENLNDSITQAWNRIEEAEEASRVKKRFLRRDCESDDSGVG